MINTLQPSDEQFLASVRSIGERLDRAQRQITTGRRVNSAVDDPDQISTLLATRADLARVQQIDSNLNRVKTEIDTGETVLASVTKLMERASTLAAQGVSNTSSAETRSQLAGEIDAILQQIVSLSGTTVEDRYIFSGTNDTVVPYAIDPLPPNAVSSYGGSNITKKALDAVGGTFEIGRTAQEIFDHPDPNRNVFASLRALRDSLTADDTGAIKDAFAQTKSASQHVISMHATYGTAQNRLANSIETAKSSITKLTTRIASIEDADLTTAILDFNQATQDQQAAFEARAKLPRGSLFDYLG
jgi:flagellar hook-associated protein 3 FlgL